MLLMPDFYTIKMALCAWPVKVARHPRSDLRPAFSAQLGRSSGLNAQRSSPDPNRLEPASRDRAVGPTPSCPDAPPGRGWLLLSINRQPEPERWRHEALDPRRWRRSSMGGTPRGAQRPSRGWRSGAREGPVDERGLRTPAPSGAWSSKRVDWSNVNHTPTERLGIEPEPFSERVVQAIGLDQKSILTP